MKGQVIPVNKKSSPEGNQDEILKALWDAIIEDEEGVHLTDPGRMRELLLCHEAMKKVFKGQGVKITCTPHSTFASMGTVEVSGKSLVVYNTPLFVKASSLASNYYVYPKLDGTIVLELTFHGMTVKG